MEILIAAVFLHVIVFGGGVTNRRNYFSALIPSTDWREQQTEPGCWLGEEFHKLGSKFNPVLEPHGRMFCVICQCIPVTRKGILQHFGKTKCVNVKNRCPLPKCRDPVMLSGRCCKSCREQSNVFEEDFSIIPENSSKDMSTILNSESLIHQKLKNKQYVALLVGKNVIGGRNIITRAVAVVYLKVTEEGALQYAVKVTRLKDPKMLQITDESGHVLLEQKLKSKSRDSKYCGEWDKVSFLYLRYLYKRRLYVAITTSKYPRGEISGAARINKNRQQHTFLALLVSPSHNGIGGFAEFTYGIRNKNLEYIVTYDGLHNVKRNRQEFFVTIEKRTKILHQLIRRTRRKKNRKFKGLWIKMDKKSRKLVSRNKLRLRITSKGGSTMIGEISTPLICGAFVGVLSSSEALVYPQMALSSSGLALFQLHDNGHINYQVHLFGMKGRVSYLTLETSPTRRGRRKVIFNLSGQFQKNGSSFDGTASGIITSTRAKYIALLLSGKLFVNVETSRRTFTAMRGRIEHLSFNGAIDFNTVMPNMLMSLPSMPTGVAGAVWLAIDSSCRLHYQVILSGLRDYSSLTALLTGEFDREASVSKNAIYTIIISDFVNGMATGVITDISSEVYQSLHEGTSFLHASVVGVLKGEVVANLSVSSDCWHMSRDQGHGMVIDEDGTLIIKESGCANDGRFHKNYDSWVPKNNSCSTCSCKDGKVECHSVICPRLSCVKQIKLDNECCSSCANDIDLTKRNISCFYTGDKRHHRAGTTWHPYIPPTGYSTCVLCHCEPDTLEVKCKHKPCPVLPCPSSVAIRLNENDCCQICSNYTTIPTPNAIPTSTDSVQEGDCTLGNRVYKNKARWHPNLSSHGIAKCVKCRCNNGKIRCKRKKCKTKEDCDKSSLRKNKCCSNCPVTT